MSAVATNKEHKVGRDITETSHIIKPRIRFCSANKL